MKRNRNYSLAVGVAAIFALSATAAFGQYGQYGYLNGACGPTACEAPTYSAPVCDVPVCDAPTCDVPACDVPSYSAPVCDVPTCAPEACEPVGGGYYGGISGDCGYYGGICIPFCDVSQVVGGVLNVATTPFHWVASMLTDGIYDGCGCAPAPARTPCNPCDICGNYVGGCEDYCQAPYYGNGTGGTVDVYGAPVAPRAAASNGSYPVGVYGSDRQDSTPSRRQAVPQAAPQNAAPEALPAEAVNRAAFAPRPVRPAFDAQAFNVRSFNVQELFGNVPSSNAVRQVGYEERRVVARPQTLAEVPQALAAPQNAAPVVENAPRVSENRPARKTYGQVRPNQTAGTRVF